MSVKVLVGDKAVRNYQKELNKFNFKLDLRKTLGGDYVIYDHKEIDIVVMPKIKKIVAFVKDSISDLTYDTQARFFDYLSKKGVVSRDSIQAGNVYASIQAKLETPASEAVDPVQVAIFAIAKFIEEEKPKYEYLDHMEDEEEKWLTEPTDEEATDLGDVPHAREKGSIRPGIYNQVYMHNRFYGMHE
tara:strand:+ start:574 stop:1137 length:564 start_codon:yes stop_codon:yes gene_type:complete